MLTSQLNADWSSFAHITPDTEADFKLKISLSPVKNHVGKYSIKLKAVEYNSKLAWLVITKKPLSLSGQKLREHIWSNTKPEQKIVAKAQLLPTGIKGLDIKTILTYFARSHRFITSFSTSIRAKNHS